MVQPVGGTAKWDRKLPVHRGTNHPGQVIHGDTTDPQEPLSLLEAPGGVGKGLKEQINALVLLLLGD
jgi:hypothetical protein